MPSKKGPPTNLIGKAKEFEIAGRLMRHGIHVYLPFVDVGVDLIATNEQATKLIPLQVKYRAKATGLSLSPKQQKRYKQAHVTLVFMIGDRELNNTYYIPYEEWSLKAKNPPRKDGRRYISLRKARRWLEQYRADAGIRRLAAKL